MPSPFPGMDPYIEVRGLWEDFHQKLIGEIEEALSRSVPERYCVRLGLRSYIVLESGSDDDGLLEHPTQADIAVTSRPDAPSRPAASSEAAIVEAPVSMLAAVSTEYREAFVEIRQVHPHRKLVTTLEVLSPSNKRRGTQGWQQYLRKRQAHLEGSAHLVEIDLLRGGERPPMAQPWPPSPYYVLVARREQVPRCQVWPAHMLRPLPRVPVPLEAPDGDVSLDLQPMIAAIYERSRYERDLDYHQPCRPPLSDAEASWLASQLRDSEASS